MVLTVEHLTRLDELEKIRDEWAELHDLSGSRNPFARPEWALHWLRSLRGPGDDVRVVTVRDKDRLVGVAPLRIHRHRLGIRRVQMVGVGPPWVGPFEMPEVLTEPARARSVLRALAGYLSDCHHEWDIATVALGDDVDWFEPDWLPAPRFTVLAHKSTAFVVLPLPLEPRGPHDGRRNLKEAVRRGRNRLTKQFGTGGWTVERITEPAAVRRAWADLARLHRARALTERGERHHDALSDPRVHDFMADVTTDLAASDRVTLYRLVARGETLAAQLVLHTRTATFMSISGFRDDAWDFSPTTYLQWTAVQDAEVRGHVEVNFSASPTRAKLRWSRTVRASPEFLLVGPSRFARVVAAPALLVGTILTGYRRAIGLPRPSAPLSRITGRSGR